MKDYIGEGDLCIDATAGNGGDTEFLCRMAGESGRVCAFDIQDAALEHTKERLEKSGLAERAVLIRDGHERMAYYVKEEVAAIMFNFGYLPGADHAVATKAKTSLAAVRSGMELLKVGGVMSLCIYSGGDSGYEEKDGVLAYLRTLDSQRYLVICSEYYNRPNHPPIPVLIVRL